jgi:hypothetical protein
MYTECESLAPSNKAFFWRIYMFSTVKAMTLLENIRLGCKRLPGKNTPTQRGEFELNTKKFYSIVYRSSILHVSTVTSTREHYLNGKAQYSWPPNCGSLFCKKVKKYFQYKNDLIQTSWYKEVNRTEPSPSVRVPCFNSHSLLLTL